MKRIRDYIQAPFKIGRMLEWMFALNWLWFFTCLTFLYPTFTSTVFTLLLTGMSETLLASMFGVFATISIVGLWKNDYILRGLALLVNIAITLLLFGASAFRPAPPYNASSGFLLILAIMLMVSFWRVKQT